MKLTVKVVGQRVKGNGNLNIPPRSADMEDYTVAEVAADGPDVLIAGHLRALADSIDPYHHDRGES